MPSLDALRQERASAKLRLEASWRVGDMEGVSFALQEIRELDRRIEQESRKAA